MQIHELLPKHPVFRYWWRWYSDWDDVGVFDFAYKKYLTQISRSRVGKAKFRTVELGRDGTNKLQM